MGEWYLYISNKKIPIEMVIQLIASLRIDQGNTLVDQFAQSAKKTFR